METRYPSVSQVYSHLQELDSQEQEIIVRLSYPDTDAGIRWQLRRLLTRIGKERQGLEEALAQHYSDDHGPQ